jgi:hypothetical protein
MRGKVGNETPGNKLLVEVMASKLIGIEGISSMEKAEMIVQQGAIVRKLQKADVLFVGETRDEVYLFMRDRVPPTDAIARLVVARWCMFNGLREQALTEARAILQFQPQNKPAADLARSLEESIKQFPPEGSAPAAKPEGGKLVTALETELEITPEAATTFATRVQPILANLCTDCHARSDYSGTFKLTRVSGFEAGPQTTQANLRATAGQLLKSDPINSPLLTKAIAAHGGLKQPPFVSRQMAGFRSLENWVVLAVGPVSSSPGGMGQVALPVPQPAQPVIPTTPAIPGGSGIVGQPMMPSVSNPGLPPVEAIPVLPSTKTMPPAMSVPVAPSIPIVPPPVVTVPPVLPTPSVMPPAVPSQPPFIPPAIPSQPPVMPPAIPSQPPIIPPADATPKLPPVPIIPIPPAVSIPPVPGGVRPASGAGTGSQFGTSAPPKQMSPSGPVGGDEFDPSIFNQGTKGK